MRSVSLQTMPNGFEFELPTFSYWFKAGIAFTLGAIVITVTLWLAYMLLLLAGAAAVVARVGH